MDNQNEINTKKNMNANDSYQAPCYNSAQLFDRGREVVIVHNQVRYQLRITRSEKLILTK